MLLRRVLALMVLLLGATSSASVSTGDAMQRQIAYLTNWAQARLGCSGRGRSQKPLMGRGGVHGMSTSNLRLPAPCAHHALQYREGACKWFPEQMPAELATHVVFAYAKLAPGGEAESPAGGGGRLRAKTLPSSPSTPLASGLSPACRIRPGDGGVERRGAVCPDPGSQAEEPGAQDADCAGRLVRGQRRRPWKQFLAASLPK